MNSHDSWIDQDEINQLITSIGGKTEEGKAESDSARSKRSGFAPQTFDSSKNTDRDDTTPIAEGSEAIRFKLGTPEDDEENEPMLTVQTAPKSHVVQALAEVRNRANRGGLLRASVKRGDGSLWPDFPPLDDDAEAKDDGSSGPIQGIDVIDPPAEPPEPKNENDGDRPKPVPLRKRLEQFAEGTVSKFDATGFSLTDFAGYRLFQRGSADNLAHTDATSLMTEQINRLSEVVGAPELGSTQISLSDDRWLCLVEASSAAGGILAQLQIPEPMNSGFTTQFRRDLEAVLVG